ncbi:MAG: type II toxin-antitoxin system RelE/ParE family toxin [Armatimonadota bacterium]|nr:type II toxin-antitoxin system RelE/ParE family toxin [Armatimonadota bacterium]
MVQAVLLKRGTRFDIYTLQRPGADCSLVMEYLNSASEGQRAKLVGRIVRMAERGPYVHSVEKSRSLMGTNLFELKEHPTRVIWFYDRTRRGVIVMTHAFDKRTDTTPAQEIARAERLQGEYYDVAGTS